jgi:hypothetical protein
MFSVRVVRPGVTHSTGHVWHPEVRIYCELRTCGSKVSVRLKTGCRGLPWSIKACAFFHVLPNSSLIRTHFRLHNWYSWKTLLNVLRNKTIQYCDHNAVDLFSSSVSCVGYIAHDEMKRTVNRKGEDPSMFQGIIPTFAWKDWRNRPCSYFSRRDSNRVLFEYKGDASRHP